MRFGWTWLYWFSALTCVVSFGWAQPRASSDVATPGSGASDSSASPSSSAASGREAPPTAPQATGSTTSVPPPASPSEAPPTQGGSPGAAAAPGLDGSTYLVRLRDLEQRIDELKEQIRRSHTRLSLLSETVLSGGAGGARADVVFVNDLSSTFRVTQALFVLDGAVQYNKQDETGLLASQKEIPIFSGSIPPGDHTLQILLKLRGHGYGVFSYLRSYQFEIRNTHSFTVTEGKSIDLRAIAFEKGDVTTAIEQRPAVRYAQKMRTGLKGAEGDTPLGGGKAGGGSAKISVGAGSE